MTLPARRAAAGTAGERRLAARPVRPGTELDGVVRAARHPEARPRPAHPFDNQFTLRYTLPSGMSPAPLPAPERRDGPFGAWSVSMREEGGALVAEGDPPGLRAAHRRRRLPRLPGVPLRARPGAPAHRPAGARRREGAVTAIRRVAGLLLLLATAHALAAPPAAPPDPPDSTTGSGEATRPRPRPASGPTPPGPPPTPGRSWARPCSPSARWTRRPRWRRCSPSSPPRRATRLPSSRSGGSATWRSPLPSSPTGPMARSDPRSTPAGSPGWPPTGPGRCGPSSPRRAAPSPSRRACEGRTAWPPPGRSPAPSARCTPST